MGVNVTFDTGNRLMIVTAIPAVPPGAVVAQLSLDVEIDMYSDAKEDWKANANGERKNKFPFATAESAGSLLPGGQVEPAFFRFRNDLGWRLLPYDSNHELTLLGNLVPFDESLPIFASRAGRTILIFRDGSQVAQMTTQTVINAVEQTPSIMDLAFLEKHVWVDTEAVAAGDGSQEFPFNTLTAAVDFAESRNWRVLHILSDIVIDRLLKNFTIVGVGVPTVDCNGQNLNQSEFNRVKMQGAYTGTIIVQESVLLNGFSLNGFFENNALAGDLICSAGASVLMTNNVSGIPGLGRPTISMNATGTAQLSVRKNGGGLTIKDCNQATDAVTVEVSEGSLTFDASNTDGDMVARGICEFIDLATAAGANVTDETVPPSEVMEMHTRLGLEKGNPFTDTPSQLSDNSGDIVITLTGDGETSTTQTRQ